MCWDKPRWTATYAGIHPWTGLWGATSPERGGVAQDTHCTSPLDRKLQQ